MDAVKDILAQNIVGTVATLNDDGSPWATSVHVFADDEAIYWFSKSDHQHSRNVARDARVSVALWSQDGGTKGAYVSGKATQLDAEETAAILATVVVGTAPPFFNGTSAYRLPLGQLNEARSSDKRWYFYS